MPSPHRRHSVWIDVFGVVALLAAVLVPLGYLATEMIGGGAGVESSPPLAERTSPAPSGARTPVPGRPSAFVRPSPPRSERTTPSSASVRAPFSDQWQARATPDLSGPSVGASGGFGGSVAGGGGTAGATGAAPSSFGRTGRSPVPGGWFGDGPSAGRLGGVGGGSGPALAARTGGTDGSDEARSAAGEARELAGRMRALSSQLGQMDRSDARTSPSGVQNNSDSGPGAPDDPDRRNPGTPSNVPIGDHLHWLAALGILWGVWRLGRGA